MVIKLKNCIYCMIKSVNVISIVKSMSYEPYRNQSLHCDQLDSYMENFYPKQLPTISFGLHIFHYISILL